jgi:HAD superfamily hydrolase (TIGR01549 family)
LNPDPRPFAGVQALIFDLGSTLIYFDAPWEAVRPLAEAALLNSLAEVGSPVEAAEFLPRHRRLLDQFYKHRENPEFFEVAAAYVLNAALQELGLPALEASAARRALAAMYAVSQRHWRSEADAHPTLQTLLGRGYHLGMISNAADDADVQTLVDNAGLRGYFDFILVSAAVGVRKPNPRIFRQGLAQWGLPPERAAMIGDMLGADILGARNTGLAAVWITRRADVAANRAHLDTIQPDAQVASLAELLELFPGPAGQPGGAG